MKVKSESEVAQSCLTLSDPMDWSLPGSSVHGIFQARVLEWGAIAFSEVPKHTQVKGKYKVEWGFPGGSVVKNLPAIQETKAMAPHSSTLAWKTPWTEEPGRLQSMGSLRVRHD